MLPSLHHRLQAQFKKHRPEKEDSTRLLQTVAVPPLPAPLPASAVEGLRSPWSVRGTKTTGTEVFPWHRGKVVTSVSFETFFSPSLG